MIKGITINCATRDPEGNLNGNLETSGTTEDDGVTCVIGLGYLPQLSVAPPEDIKLTVHQPVVDYMAPTVVSVTPDEENGQQTVVFTLP